MGMMPITGKRDLTPCTHDAGFTLRVPEQVTFRDGPVGMDTRCSQLVAGISSFLEREKGEQQLAEPSFSYLQKRPL